MRRTPNNLLGIDAVLCNMSPQTLCTGRWHCCVLRTRRLTDDRNVSGDGRSSAGLPTPYYSNSHSNPGHNNSAALSHAVGHTQAATVPKG
jgi:hypothetical protein